MVPVQVRVNSFFQDNHKFVIDPLSKYYIVLECMLGLNRLPLMIKRKNYFYLFTALACAYSVTIIFSILYITYQPMFDNMAVWISLVSEYIFCVTISFVTWKRMERYYNEINKFDSEIGCRPKMTSESLRHSIFMTVLLVVITLFHSSLAIFVWSIPISWSMPLVILDLLHCLETSYYGHLLSLLVPRMRLINYYMASALSNGSSAKRPNIEEFVSFKNKNNRNSDMKKLMDLYHILIKTYDLLMDAIKWQLLVILIVSFICTLSLCYDFAYHLMHNQSSTMDSIISLGVMAMQMLPLFSPCIFGDRVHNEVRKLRELIASRLYENKLDKVGRSTARALLALTEARDLSFSLLRMLQVDVALPFKFAGLLVTYLIILLQFDKVIHPTTPVTTTPST